jgi:hypothetical protein
VLARSDAEAGLTLADKNTPTRPDGYSASRHGRLAATALLKRDEATHAIP